MPHVPFAHSLARFEKSLVVGDCVRGRRHACANGPLGHALASAKTLPSTFLAGGSGRALPIAHRMRRLLNLRASYLRVYGYCRAL